LNDQATQTKPETVEPSSDRRSGSILCSLPSPFYQDDLCTIYHGDCYELLPLVGDVDLVLTDPPYGINHATDFASRGRSTWGKPKDYAPCRGDDEQFDPKIIVERFDRWILWGANHYKQAIPDGASWLIWDKRTRNDKGTNDQADGEMAATAFGALVTGVLPAFIDYFQVLGCERLLQLLLDGSNASGSTGIIRDGTNGIVPVHQGSTLRKGLTVTSR